MQTSSGKLPSSTAAADGAVVAAATAAFSPSAWPKHEEARRTAACALQLLDSPQQPKCEAVMQLARQMLQVPVAVVVPAPADSHCEACGSPPTPRGLSEDVRRCSFSDWAAAAADASLLVVEDALQNASFKSAAFVVGPPGVRFYAAAPLSPPGSSGSRPRGWLCLLDFRPRALDSQQREVLSSLALACVHELEMQAALRREGFAARARLRAALDCTAEGIALLDLSTPGWRLLAANSAFRDAACLGQWPSGAEDTDADFWSVFGHVTDGKDSHKAALDALAAVRAFNMAVRPPSTCASGPPPVVRLLFRPADGEGCAACLARGRPSRGSAALGVALRSARADPFGVAPAAASPLLYFAVVRAVEKAEPRLLQLSPQLTPLVTGRMAKSASISCLQALSRQGSDAAAEAGFAGGLRRDISMSAMSQYDGSCVLPSFLAQRPDVMKEVQLGPLVGSGSAGRCYRAQWQGGRVAVKIVECNCDGSTPGGSAGLSPATSGHLDSWHSGHSGHSSAKPAAEAAMLEALLSRSLAHPHIVTTYAHAVSKKQCQASGEWRQAVWIVQEYCSRGSLLEAVDKGWLSLPQGGPNLPAVLTAAMEIAGALLYLHQHDIVHGDLTLNNVLLNSSTRDSRRWVCKVGDFGLSQIIHSDFTEIQGSFGTLTHAAPELVLEGMLSKAADVYSFGVILLELHNGRRVWKGFSFMQILAAITAGTQPHEIPHDCPPALASLLRRCLDKEPAKRPGFAAILHELQAMLATLARAAPAAAPATPPLSVSHPSSSDLASLGQQLSPFAQPTDAQAAGPACTDQLLNAIPERTAGAA